MNEQDLKPGDLVKLKSGGPEMTYGSNDTSGRAVCMWFFDGKMERQSFPICALDRAGK